MDGHFPRVRSTALMLLLLALATPPPTRATPLPLDDFLCYRSVTTPGTTPVPTLLDLHMVDRVEDVVVDAEHQKHLCVPARVDGSSFVNPDVSLRAKFVRSNGQTPTFVRRRNVTTSDRFGSVTVDLVRRFEIFIPTSLAQGSPAPAPDPSAHDVDHFRCYRTGGASALRGVTVTIADVLRGTPRPFTLARPKELCVPVDVNGAGVEDRGRNLMCYAVVPAPGTLPTRVNGLYLSYEYGTEQTDTVREYTLCVPSVITP